MHTTRCPFRPAEPCARFGEHDRLLDAGRLLPSSSVSARNGASLERFVTIPCTRAAQGNERDGVRLAPPPRTVDFPPFPVPTQNFRWFRSGMRTIGGKARQEQDVWQET